MLPVRLRTLGFFLLKLGLAVATVAYAAHVVEWGEIVAAARQAEAGWIAAAVLLLPANVGLEAYRWHRLVRRLAPEVRFSETLAAVLSGYPLGLATPGRLGDYVGRAFYLRYADKWALAALTFAERMATLAISLAAGLVVLAPFLLTHTALPSAASAAGFAVGGVLVAAFVYLLLHPRTAHRWLGRLLPERLAPRLDVFDAFDARDARSLLALSALRYGIFSAQFVCLVFSFAPATGWGTAVMGVVLVFFAKSAIPSFTLADLGIREGAAVFFLGALGVGGAAAFNAAFLLFCVNIVGPSLVGLPFILKLRFADDEGVPAAVEVPA